MGIWHSRQTTCIRGNRFHRRPERSDCFGLSLFRQAALQALTQPAAPDVPRLASGIYAGYLVRWMLLGLGSVLRPNWPDSDPRTRFIARHDAALVIIPFSIFFI